MFTKDQLTASEARVKELESELDDMTKQKDDWYNKHYELLSGTKQ